MTGKLGAFGGALIALAVGAAAAPAVHTRLRSSVPAAGDTVAVAPASVRLEFSEAVGPSVLRVVLRSLQGSDTLALRADSSDPMVVHAALPPIGPGAYRLVWRAVSVDGHPVTDHFVFYVSGPNAASTAFAPPPPADAAVSAVPPGRAVLRAATGVALAAFAGLLLLGIVVAPEGRGIATGRLAKAAGAAAAALAAGHLAVSATALSGGGITGGLATLWSLPTGKAAVVQVVSIVLALWALLLARAPRVATAFAVAGMLAGSAIGHSVAYAPAWSVPSKAVHLVAVAVWTGGLIVLATGSGDLAVARRVSTAALWSVIALAATGLVQSIVLLPSFGALVSSAYGRLVIGKTAGLLVLVGFGARNRLRLLPEAENGRAGPLQQSVRWETAVLVAVILLGGVLASTPPPADPTVLTGVMP